MDNLKCKHIAFKKGEKNLLVSSVENGSPDDVTGLGRQSSPSAS
jgi:hypothetical protein